MHKNKYSIFYFIDKFDKIKLNKLDKNIHLIYRNYHKKIDYNLIKKIKLFCKIKQIKFYISNNIKLAIKLGLDGAYIPSFNKKIIQNIYLKRKDFSILGSAHNLVEIRIKEKQGVDKIFLSPIFDTKEKKGLGIIKFNNLSRCSRTNIIALGGINESNINKLKLTKVDGFASISYIDNLYK